MPNLNKMTDNSSNLSFIYTNADCLTNKRPELLAFLNALSYKPSVIIITEINSKCSYNKMQEPEFVLDGYNMYCCNIGTVGSRGVIIYVNSALHSSQVETDTKFEECVFVQIKMRDARNLLVGGFYRSPNSSLENNLHLEKLITEINKDSSLNTIFVGDFNCPNINWTDWTI
ncbi:MAG: endonuclease/exonuclease/phosphatase family protein [Nitrososphaerales archaeon]